MTTQTHHSSRPALLLVVTISLMLLALAAYWVAALPQRLARGLATSFGAENGLVIDYVSPRLTYNSRPMLVLDSLAVRPRDHDSFDLTARSVVIAGGWGMLFGGMAQVQDVILDKPVLSVDVTASRALALPPVTVLAYRDGVVKLRDKTLSALVAVTDVNGRILADPSGFANLQASFLQNNLISNLTVDIENGTRLAGAGSPVDALLHSNGQSIGFSGLARLANGLALDGRLTADAASSATFAAWLGVPMALLENASDLSLDSSVSMSGLALRLPTLTGHVGEVAVSGEMQLAAGADRPRLSGTLASDALTVISATEEGNRFARPWPETPWPLQDLMRLDLDLAISTKALTLHGEDFGPASLTLRNEAGQARATLQTTGEGGTAKAELGLALQKGVAATTLTLATKDRDAKAVLGGFFGFPHVSGKANIAATLAGEGRSLAGVISSLHGTVEVSGTQLSLAGVNLGNLLALPGQGWQGAASESSAGLTLKLKAAVQEGIFTLAEGNLEGQGFALKPRGEVDVLRQAFDLTLNPAGKGLDPKLTLTGYWTSPVFQAGAAALRGGTDAEATKTPATPPAN